MAGSTISGTVTQTVTLGSASYPSPLTVTTTGDVAISTTAAIGIYLPAGSGTLINDGTVTGGAGHTYNSSPLLNGGTGVYILGGSTAINSGTITGGVAGYDRVGPGPAFGGIGGAGVLLNGGILANSGLIAGGYSAIGRGGYGVSLMAGTLTNTGMIAGGNANKLFSEGPFGAAGVQLAASATLVNDGTITGGYAGSGGSGISLRTGASLTQNGVVTGGAGYSSGGIGASLLNGATLDNTGTITGGAAKGVGPGGGASGGGGVDVDSGSELTNAGFIAGGSGSDNFTGVIGGSGVGFSGSALINTGFITGGMGGGGSFTGGAGGAGVDVSGSTATNSAGAVIIGGAGGEGTSSFAQGGAGGIGASLYGGTLTNAGTILGGDAGTGFSAAGVERGGDGAKLAASAALFNSGTISGGTGVFGGTGIVLVSGASLANTGVIIGGVGSNYGESGYGANLIDGGSLDNIGTIIGGSGGGTSESQSGADGVAIGDAGELTNTGTIVGGGASGGQNSGSGGTGGGGVGLQNGSTLTNAGFIAGGQGGAAAVTGGTGGSGLNLLSGSDAVTNNAGATIMGGAGGSGLAYSGDGGTGGAGASLSGGTLTNAGTILGGNGGVSTPMFRFGGNGGAGISLTAGAVVSNTGSISGGSGGYGYAGESGGAGARIGSSSSGGTLDNSGVITGGKGQDVASGGTSTRGRYGSVAGGDGAYVGSGGMVSNTGTFIGGTGVHVGSGGAFTNDGTILGGDGAVVASGGTLINTGTVISGIGVYLASGAMLTNAGTISGGVYGGVTADAVMFAAAGTLVVDPGASFIGQVVANATSTDALYLAAASNIGTLTGLGTQFTNFSETTIGAGASWALTGANTVASGTIASGATLTELTGASLTDTSTLVNDGSIVLDPSTMVVAGLTGTGLATIDAGSTLQVQGTVSGGETILFGGSGAYLHLDSLGGVAGSITNFSFGETIDLKGVSPSTVDYDTATNQLTFSGGDIALTLGSSGTVSASASTDGTQVTVLCFCANTLILTPSGERPVQDLAVGDLVTTRRGEARPVIWIGAGKVLATRGHRNAATPVIIRKGALADNVPNRDLRVTRGHAFWFDGALIPVEFLVNHRLIEWDDRAQEVALYHIELATHDVLVANGAPAESYRDDGNRWLFHNANSGWDLPPLAPCAAVLTGGPFVDAVWRRLLERAGPRPGFALTGDPDLHLLADGKRLDARQRQGAAYIFHLPSRPASVRIVSRAGAPAELGMMRDPRLLGVALRRIALRQGSLFRVMQPDNPALNNGFHAFEPADGLRWTDGDATLPPALFEGFEGAAELVLHIGDTTQYPMFDEPAQAQAA